MTRVNLGAFEALRIYCIQRRHEIGFSQDELATASGVSKGTISNFEAGGRPSIPSQRTLTGLAKGLRVPYWMLDRIARGLPADGKLSDADVAVIMSEADPELRALLIEAATASQAHQRALKAALAAALETLRQSQRP